MALPRQYLRASCLIRNNCIYRRSLASISPARVSGPREPALLEHTVPEHFKSIVSQYGDRTAVVSSAQKTRLTYRLLDERSNALARGLAGLGITKGDRVAVFLGNNIEYTIATYALFKLGAILVPLNPAFSPQQVSASLNHLDASCLIVSLETNLSRKPPISNVDLLRFLAPNLERSSVQSEQAPSLRHIVIVDNSNGRIDASNFHALNSFRSLIHHDTNALPTPADPLKNTDIVNIQFTSGTTSTPKAACLTHRSILNNGKSIGDRMLLTEQDIVCCPPPLFHCFGCILGFMATATHGASIVFPSEAFDPLATLRAVRDEKATGLYGVPTMFLAEFDVLADPNTEFKIPDDFATLRTGIAAGSSVPAELMRKIHRQLNLTELTICYGMTETSPVSAMTTTDDPLHHRIETVGRLLPHVEAKVVDPVDRNRILPRGERGELAVSGYLVMKGYWNDPVKTAEAMLEDADGRVWMHTGDEALLNSEGYVQITGRIKDLIIRGGENLHPLEIENSVLSHPGVADVSIVGLPDERYGEVPAAFVVRQPKRDTKSAGSEESTAISKEDVRTWVRERLNRQLVPKYVFWVEEFPKTASGKIQKFKLREEGVKLLQAGEGTQD